MSTETELFDLNAIVAELSNDADERHLMARTLSLLAHAAPHAAPPESLRSRVLAQLAIADRGPQFEDSGFFFAKGNDIAWTDVNAGIRSKLLYGDPPRGARTVLVEMAPNLLFPSHDHHAIEDLYLISGDLWVGEIPMRAGDYCRAPGGTTHDDVRSGPSGALVVVVQR